LYGIGGKDCALFFSKTYYMPWHEYHQQHQKCQQNHHHHPVEQPERNSFRHQSEEDAQTSVNKNRLSIQSQSPTHQQPLEKNSCIIIIANIFEYTKCNAYWSRKWDVVRMHASKHVSILCDIMLFEHLFLRLAINIKNTYALLLNLMKV